MEGFEIEQVNFFVLVKWIGLTQEHIWDSRDRVEILPLRDVHLGPLSEEEKVARLKFVMAKCEQSRKKNLRRKWYCQAVMPPHLKNRAFEGLLMPCQILGVSGKYKFLL